VDKGRTSDHRQKNETNEQDQLQFAHRVGSRKVEIAGSIAVWLLAQGSAPKADCGQIIINPE
jgi:hypothetical protein